MTIENEKEWFYESEFVIRLCAIVYIVSIFPSFLVFQTCKKGLNSVSINYSFSCISGFIKSTLPKEIN